MKETEDKFVVFSDVNPRDGIGIELYIGDEVIVEVFRDDTKRTRELTTFSNSVSLDQIEKAIQIFKKEVPWDFIEYD